LINIYNQNNDNFNDKININNFNQNINYMIYNLPNNNNNISQQINLGNNNNINMNYNNPNIFNDQQMNIDNNNNFGNINYFNINKNIFYKQNFINNTYLINNPNNGQYMNNIFTQISNMNNVQKEEKKLDPKDYLLKMFGRVGWICKQCNNFNFETRNKCNRCLAIKNPKTIEEINKKKDDKKNKKKVKERKTDWLCLNCQNLNYGFRKNCNRCQIQRKDEYPSIYLQPNQKINGNNNIIIYNNLYNVQCGNGLNNQNNNFNYKTNNYNNNIGSKSSKNK